MSLTTNSEWDPFWKIEAIKKNLHSTIKFHIEMVSFSRKIGLNHWWISTLPSLKFVQMYRAIADQIENRFMSLTKTILSGEILEKSSCQAKRNVPIKFRQTYQVSYWNGIFLAEDWSETLANVYSPKPQVLPHIPCNCWPNRKHIHVNDQKLISLVWWKISE